MARKRITKRKTSRRKVTKRKTTRKKRVTRKKPSKINLNVIFIVIAIIVILLGLVLATITGNASKKSPYSQRAISQSNAPAQESSCKSGDTRCQGDNVQRCTHERWRTVQSCDRGCEMQVGRAECVQTYRDTVDCFDSDGGINPLVNGTISFDGDYDYITNEEGRDRTNNEGNSATDVCADYESVQEYYCLNGQPMNIYINCQREFGMFCDEGSCVDYCNTEERLVCNREGSVYKHIVDCTGHGEWILQPNQLCEGGVLINYMCNEPNRPPAVGTLVCEHGCNAQGTDCA